MTPAATAAPTMNSADLATLGKLHAVVASSVYGKPEAIRLALAALLARGHLLIEDVPGVGKTTLASALARAVGGAFSRIQFTSDLLPSDITGVSVFEPQLRRFEFRPGPLFANVVLADEINRTTPKTQSALLEAMSERRVSADGVTRFLPDPFFVVATQNPIEHHGTFPLPDSQMDRFLLRIRLGYPPAEAERAILESGAHGVAAEQVEAVTDPAGLAALQRVVDGVRAVPAIVEYIVAIAHATRTMRGVLIGVSPRGSLALLRASRAGAILAGRDYVTPDDVQGMAPPALAHRLVLEGAEDGADRETAEAALAAAVESVPVPR